MEWINKPFIDAIDYFSSMIYECMQIARQTGTLLCMVGLVWYGIQMAFGTLEMKKALVGTITKILFFMIILNVYPTATALVKGGAISIGKYVSGDAQEKIKTNFANLHAEVKKIVETENEEIQAEMQAALLAKETLTNLQTDTSLDYWGGYGVGDQHLAQVSKRVSDAQAVIENRNNDPSSAMKTIEAIESVLIPLDENGIPIRDMHMADKYNLDLYLRDSEGMETDNLSPSAIMRLALLTAQILWEKEWASVTEDWTANDEEGFFSGMTKTLSVDKFPFYRIFDIILTFICMIAIVLAMIFTLMQYITGVIEFTIIISFAILCVPCMLMDGLKDIANKVLPAILSQAVKLTMITVCMFYAIWAFLDLAVNTFGSRENFNLTTFAYVLFVIILANTLCLSAPKLASALLNGQPQLSMGELVATMAGAVALGNRTAALARTGTQAAVSGAAKATRFGMNRAGDVAAMVGAGSAAFGAESRAGAPLGYAWKSSFKAAAGEGLHRAGQNIKGGLHDFAHSGMKGSGMGGGSGTGGSGVNRFGYDNYSIDKPGVSSRNYATAQSINKETGERTGLSMTASEYLRSQFEAGASRKKATSTYVGKGPKPSPMLPPPLPLALPEPDKK